MADKYDSSYTTLRLEAEKAEREYAKCNEDRREAAFNRVLQLGSWSFGVFLVVFAFSFLIVFAPSTATANSTGWHIIVFPITMGTMTIAMLLIAGRMVYISSASKPIENQDSGHYISPISAVVDSLQDKT